MIYCVVGKNNKKSLSNDEMTEKSYRLCRIFDYDTVWLPEAFILSPKGRNT